MRKLALIAATAAFMSLPLNSVFAQVEKIDWCHCEPNGNCQSLSLPMQALENAGHVDANGSPLHAGDYAGVCKTPQVPEFGLVTGAIALITSAGAFYALKNRV
jgi:hypothetical protein